MHVLRAIGPSSVSSEDPSPFSEAAAPEGEEAPQEEILSTNTERRRGIDFSARRRAEEAVEERAEDRGRPGFIGSLLRKMAQLLIAFFSLAFPNGGITRKREETVPDPPHDLPVTPPEDAPSFSSSSVEPSSLQHRGRPQGAVQDVSDEEGGVLRTISLPSLMISTFDNESEDEHRQERVEPRNRMGFVGAPFVSTIVRAEGGGPGSSRRIFGLRVPVEFFATSGNQPQMRRLHEDINDVHDEDDRGVTEYFNGRVVLMDEEPGPTNEEQGGGRVPRRSSVAFPLAKALQAFPSSEYRNWMGVGKENGDFRKIKENINKMAIREGRILMRWMAFRLHVCRGILIFRRFWDHFCSNEVNHTVVLPWVEDKQWTEEEIPMHRLKVTEVEHQLFLHWLSQSIDDLGVELSDLAMKFCFFAYAFRCHEKKLWMVLIQRWKNKVKPIRGFPLRARSMQQQMRNGRHERIRLGLEAERRYHELLRLRLQLEPDRLSQADIALQNLDADGVTHAWRLRHEHRMFPIPLLASPQRFSKKNRRLWRTWHSGDIPQYAAYHGRRCPIVKDLAMPAMTRKRGGAEEEEDNTPEVNNIQRGGEAKGEVEQAVDSNETGHSGEHDKDEDEAKIEEKNDEEEEEETDLEWDTLSIRSMAVLSACDSAETKECAPGSLTSSFSAPISIEATGDAWAPPSHTVPSRIRTSRGTPSTSVPAITTGGGGGDISVPSVVTKLFGPPGDRSLGYTFWMIYEKEWTERTRLFTMAWQSFGLPAFLLSRLEGDTFSSVRGESITMRALRAYDRRLTGIQSRLGRLAEEEWTAQGKPKCPGVNGPSPRRGGGMEIDTSLTPIFSPLLLSSLEEENQPTLPSIEAAEAMLTRVRDSGVTARFSISPMHLLVEHADRDRDSDQRDGEDRKRLTRSFLPEDPETLTLLLNRILESIFLVNDMDCSVTETNSAVAAPNPKDWMNQKRKRKKTTMGEVGTEKRAKEKMETALQKEFEDLMYGAEEHRSASGREGTLLEIPAFFALHECVWKFLRASDYQAQRHTILYQLLSRLGQGVEWLYPLENLKEFTALLTVVPHLHREEVCLLSCFLHCQHEQLYRTSQGWDTLQKQRKSSIVHDVFPFLSNYTPEEKETKRSTVTPSMHSGASLLHPCRNGDASLPKTEGETEPTPDVRGKHPLGLRELDLSRTAFSMISSSDPAATLYFSFQYTPLPFQLSDVGGATPKVLCNGCCAETVFFYQAVRGPVAERDTLNFFNGGSGYDLCVGCALFYYKRAIKMLLRALHPMPNYRVPFVLGRDTVLRVVSQRLVMNPSPSAPTGIGEDDTTTYAVVVIRVHVWPPLLHPVVYAISPFQPSMPLTHFSTPPLPRDRKMMMRRRRPEAHAAAIETCPASGSLRPLPLPHSSLSFASKTSGTHSTPTWCQDVVSPVTLDELCWVYTFALPPRLPNGGAVLVHRRRHRHVRVASERKKEEEESSHLEDSSVERRRASSSSSSTSALTRGPTPLSATSSAVKGTSSLSTPFCPTWDTRTEGGTTQKEDAAAVETKEGNAFHTERPLVLEVVEDTKGNCHLYRETNCTICQRSLYPRPKRAPVTGMGGRGLLGLSSGCTDGSIPHSHPHGPGEVVTVYEPPLFKNTKDRMEGNEGEEAAKEQHDDDTDTDEEDEEVDQEYLEWWLGDFEQRLPRTRAEWYQHEQHVDALKKRQEAKFHSHHPINDPHHRIEPPLPPPPPPPPPPAFAASHQDPSVLCAPSRVATSCTSTTTLAPSHVQEGDIATISTLDEPRVRAEEAVYHTASPHAAGTDSLEMEGERRPTRRPPLGRSLENTGEDNDDDDPFSSVPPTTATEDLPLPSSTAKDSKALQHLYDTKYCFPPMGSPTMLSTTPCGHVFHYECLLSWRQHSDKKGTLRCPVCRQSLWWDGGLGPMQRGPPGNARESESDGPEEEGEEGEEVHYLEIDDLGEEQEELPSPVDHHGEEDREEGRRTPGAAPADPEMERRRTTTVMLQGPLNVLKAWENYALATHDVECKRITVSTPVPSPTTTSPPTSSGDVSHVSPADTTLDRRTHPPPPQEDREPVESAVGTTWSLTSPSLHASSSASEPHTDVELPVPSLSPASFTSDEEEEDAEKPEQQFQARRLPYFSNSLPLCCTSLQTNGGEVGSGPGSLRFLSVGSSFVCTKFLQEVIDSWEARQRWIEKATNTDPSKRETNPSVKHLLKLWNDFSPETIRAWVSPDLPLAISSDEVTLALKKFAEHVRRRVSVKETEEIKNLHQERILVRARESSLPPSLSHSPWRSTSSSNPTSDEAGPEEEVSTATVVNLKEPGEVRIEENTAEGGRKDRPSPAARHEKPFEVMTEVKEYDEAELHLRVPLTWIQWKVPSEEEDEDDEEDGYCVPLALAHDVETSESGEEPAISEVENVKYSHTGEGLTKAEGLQGKTDEAVGSSARREPEKVIERPLRRYVDVVVMGVWPGSATAYNPTHCASCEVIRIYEEE